MSKGLKKEVGSKSFEYTTGNALEIPKAVKDYCSANDLDFKWIRMEKIAKGYIKDYWTPLNLDSANIQLSGFALGKRGDGLLVREDLFLAVRPRDIGNAHKASIDQRRRAQLAKASSKGSAAHLRKEAASMGLKTEVLED